MVARSCGGAGEGQGPLCHLVKILAKVRWGGAGCCSASGCGRVQWVLLLGCGRVQWVAAGVR